MPENYNARKYAIIAAGWVVIWVVILYAGADHPPPTRFYIWLIPLVCLGGVLVFLRTPTYALWCAACRSHRLALVICDGLLVGLVVGLFVLLSPHTGEPSIPAPGWSSTMIWLSVLMGVGAFNTLVLYGIVSTTAKDMD